jgi:hypothetical protein
MACWQTNNNPVTILFNLTAGQIATMTLRAGITCAYAGGRPKPTVNAYTPSSNPSPSSQPNSRSLTVGTYRGNNWLYTFSIPSSAFVVGQNTLVLNVISGSGSIGPYLNPACAYDAVELDIPNSGPTVPTPPSSLTATPINMSQINLRWQDNSTNEINFLIERSTDNVSFSLIAAVTAAVTNYSDVGLLAGITYYYRVRTSNSGGSSSYTSVASATTYRPRFTSITQTGGIVVLRGTNGPPGSNYFVLSSSNVTLPLWQWSRVQTNQFSSNSTFAVTNSFTPSAPQRFYLLQLP